MEINRIDIYYCSNCGYFFDRETDKLFDVSYTEIPAEFALKVMSDRSVRFRTCHMTARRNLCKKSRK